MIKSTITNRQPKGIIHMGLIVAGILVLGLVAIVSSGKLKTTTTTPEKSSAAGPICETSFVVRARTTNTPTPTPFICRRTVDITLALDRSSSMNTVYNGKTKLQWEKEAALAFVEASRASMAQGKVRIGLNSYGAQGNTGTRVLPTGYPTPGYDSSKDQGLTADAGLLTQKINAIKVLGDGSCIECGMRLLRTQVYDFNRTNTSKALILISDGLGNRIWNGTPYLEPTYLDEDPSNPANVAAVNEAKTGKDLGIEYFVLGYGSGNSINPTTLKDIANDPDADHYSQNNDPTKWAQELAKMFGQICD